MKYEGRDFGFNLVIQWKTGFTQEKKNKMFFKRNSVIEIESI